jgi:hypothetical protein
MRGRFFTQSIFNNNGLSAKAQNNSQRVPGINAMMYGYDTTNNGVDVKTTHDPQERIRYNGDEPVHFGSDSVRTLVPGADLDVKMGHGDPRLIAAKAFCGFFRLVPSSAVFRYAMSSWRTICPATTTRSLDLTPVALPGSTQQDADSEYPSLCHSFKPPKFPTPSTRWRTESARAALRRLRRLGPWRAHRWLHQQTR